MFLLVDAPPQIEMVVEEAPYIFDRIVADVTGDGVDDFIYLVGNKTSPDAIYQEDISIYVVDGLTDELHAVSLPLNGGYASSLFVGDFNGDFTKDVFVSVNSGNSSNTSSYYIYSFKETKPEQILDDALLNDLFEWEVSFINKYGVVVKNVTLQEEFTLNISHLDEELLGQYYSRHGKVKEKYKGEVLPIGGLVPIMAPEGKEAFHLLSSQAIVGSKRIDEVGVVEISLKYVNGSFIPYDVMIGNRVKP